MSEEPLLEIRNLHTQFETDLGTVQAVQDVNFTVNRGETFGVVGESGAGKSVTGLSILGLIESPGRITDGELIYKGTDLLRLSDKELGEIRGKEISTIFQDPMSSLNPSYTVGEQIIDVILEHTDLSKKEARERTVELFTDVGISDPRSRVDEYPHQLSGGMRQRVMIAMALSCNPDLIIADEPTTSLDVTIQAQILELLSDLQEEYETSIVIITHNMGVVAKICDSVGVMYAGEIVERGPIEDVLRSPQHPYTVGLLKSIPRLNDSRGRLDTIPGNMPDLVETPTGCSFHTRCPFATEECKEVDPALIETSSPDHQAACIHLDDIRYDGDFEPETIESPEKRSNPSTDDVIVKADNLKKYFTPESETTIDCLLRKRKHVHAVDNVSFEIRKGETLGLVGESGCGKTTLGRTLSRLYEPTDGTILFAGSDFTELDRKGLRNARSDLQVIFQDPFSSLNPRRTVKNIIGRPLEIHGLVENEKEKKRRVVELLEQVGLDESHLNRYPHEFSGGQKQRIGVARALAVEPDFIVADEPVSGLDVSIQAQIINLLMDLQDEYELTYLFISHDLNVVQHISDRIAVMYLGEIVEVGDTDAIFSPPYHPYTEALLSSIPSLELGQADDRRHLEGTVPSPIDPPSGCRFRTRCPYATEECAQISPSLTEMGDDHKISCHIFTEEENEEHFDIKEIEANQQDVISTKAPTAAETDD